jgi:hypothetical protein
MPTYTVCFYTEADWAETTIKARTPTRALAAARCIADDEVYELNFQSYDSTNGIERIVIMASDGRTVADWKSGDLHLRLAASALLKVLEAQTEAAQAVVDSWEAGDLAGAVRGLDASLDGARCAIARAKGGVS